MRVGIVGCGLIGRRRADVVRRSPGDELVIVADVDKGRAGSLALEIGCLTTTDWREVVVREDVDAVIVSTPNKFLMPVTVAALENGKHVLVEKPMARNLAEAEAVLRTTRRQGDKACPERSRRETRGQGDSLLLSPSPPLPFSPSPRLPVLAVGFNPRHHPAIWKAHELCSQGAIGPLRFIRAIYGHGGRPGYDKEWRADPDLAGGGELLDQGVHIVDLCRWFLGDFTEVFGLTATYVWGQKAEDGGRKTEEGIPPSVLRLPISAVEDNAFALLRTADGRVAQFHTSWTQWKNRFTFEDYGRDGSVRVGGRGGRDGPERLEVGRRKPVLSEAEGKEGGVPEVELFEFPGPDLSWQVEWQEFTSAIREGRQPLANGEDGLQAMRLIAAIYESSRTGRAMKVET